MSVNGGHSFPNKISHTGLARYRIFFRKVNLLWVAKGCCTVMVTSDITPQLFFNMVDIERGHVKRHLTEMCPALFMDL